MVSALYPGRIVQTLEQASLGGGTDLFFGRPPIFFRHDKMDRWDRALLLFYYVAYCLPGAERHPTGARRSVRRAGEEDEPCP